MYICVKCDRQYKSKQDMKNCKHKDVEKPVKKTVKRDVKKKSAFNLLDKE